MAAEKRLLLEVLKYLDPEFTLSAFLRVSHTWRHIALEDELWLFYIQQTDPTTSHLELSQFSSLRFAYFCLFCRNRYQYCITKAGELVTIDLKTREKTKAFRVKFRHSVLVLDDQRVFLCGGKQTEGGNTHISTDNCSVFSPEQSTFTTVDRMNTAKNEVCLTEMAGFVYSFGGWLWVVKSMRRRYSESATVDRWDTLTWKNTKIADLPMASANVFAGACATGIVLMLKTGCYLLLNPSLEYQKLDVECSNFSDRWLGNIGQSVLFFGSFDETSIAVDVFTGKTTDIQNKSDSVIAGRCFEFNRKLFTLTVVSGFHAILNLISPSDATISITKSLVIDCSPRP